MGKPILTVEELGHVEMTSSERVPSTEEAVARLREALAGVGVVLPSLRVDPVTGASDEPYALVALGRCNVRTAARLAAVLRATDAGRERADGPPEPPAGASSAEALRARVREVNRQGRLP
ncbi:hypothetical protein ACFY93_21225 [Streptomyces sp. NPDC008313]|uniref:hypothetical protein n=1 Tax=Streptomyces sp. NPDC008313 TaxID=3364826 RepID=UPI0036EA00A3